MSAKKILLYAPLLAWYLNRGLKLTAVYRTIDYEPREIFSWFVNEVANNRRKGDADKDKALLAEVFKLLGNSAYGKFIEAVERHTNTIYTCDEEEVDKSLRSARFKTLEEIGPAYKIELRKSKIAIDRPFQFSETEAINLKKVAALFQDTIHFHPGHLQPKTLIFTIRALVE